MSITTERDGRNLLITVEGVDEPFVVKPLPGRAGVQITETYLAASAGVASATELTAALQMAVDGGKPDPETGLWVPLPDDEQHTFNRISRELSQAEGEEVMVPAFVWQTLLGMDGVNAYIKAGGGLAGTLAAITALTARLGRLTPAATEGAS